MTTTAYYDLISAQGMITTVDSNWYIVAKVNIFINTHRISTFKGITTTRSITRLRISAAVLCQVPIHCITQSYTCRDIFRFAIVARYSTIRARIQEISKFDINIEYVHFELGLNLTCPRRFTSIETPVQYILSFFNDIFIHLLLSELQTPSSHAPFWWI